jgi:hypothetical protein
MRLALSSLIVAAGLAGVAYAQEPATQPAPPPAPPAPATATPPAPSAEAPPPAAATPPAPAAEATPAPAPTLPTSGPGFDAIQVLEKVCAPAVHGGQKLDDVAKANGFKLDRRSQNWVKQFGATDRNYQVIVFPFGSNKGVCNVELHYAPGTDVEVAKALNVWAFVHQPPLDPTANYTQPQDPDGLKRVRRSWEYLTQNQSIGLNFSTVRKPDDSPVSPKYDMGTLQYQERSF